MDGKEDEHLDEYMFMVQMVPLNGTSMQHVTYVPMKVKLDEKHLGWKHGKICQWNILIFLVESIHKLKLNTLNSLIFLL